jgi:ferrous iron transport protein B
MAELLERRVGMRSRFAVTESGIVVALAGNPNTGKSTVFNALTGLRQHTGNWPGKTVTRAEGSFRYQDKKYNLIDLPGTYSLLARTTDEEIARDFILFGKPDVVVVVVDATCLERNLNLVLQVLRVTHSVVVCLNLMDEAERHGLKVDARALEEELGVPVVPTVATRRKGLERLVAAIARVASGEVREPRATLSLDGEVADAYDRMLHAVRGAYPSLDASEWVALRLLERDQAMVEAVRRGDIAQLAGVPHDTGIAERLIEEAAGLAVSIDATDATVRAIFREAERIASRVLRGSDAPRRNLDRALDRLLTSKLFGFPVMLALLAAVFWLTIAGANVPSSLLADGLFWLEEQLLTMMNAIGAPAWLTGFLVEGVYRGLAWVVSVMLPPMAIFFPAFTLLEDLGYLPRAAFNLDRVFQKVGGHGKMALTMAMGFGCNAAGVISTRIIDSPRERLIAIITNNFMPCNGRWPTLILLATVFIAAAFPPAVGALVGAGTLVGVVLLGFIVTLLVTYGLSRTALKGAASAFALELPPYRKPQVLRVLYTSLIDRTIFVLWRAVVIAAPAGGLAWILGNVSAGDGTLMSAIVDFLDPLGRLIGLDGVIILAYIVAIPANEVVVPTMLMAYLNYNKLIEIESMAELKHLLVVENDWTILTAVCLMLFSLLHNPCSTTLWTIFKETGSKKWTLVSAFLPLGIAFLVCFLVAQTARLFG